MKPPLPFSVIYEDEELIAVNKAAGISVGADRWDTEKSRLDKLLDEYAGCRVYTVHRIDRDTSGLVVFAKNEESHRRLSLAFEGRNVKKRYVALINGRPAWKETACTLPLLPNGNKQHLTIIDKYRGKESLTRFTLLGSAGNYSLVEARPETGRTHQIRVHLAALGHPVSCDPLYGDGRPVFLSAFKSARRGDPFEERPLISRLALHAEALELQTEPPNAPLSLHAPPPRDMAALIKQLKKQGRF